MPRKRLTTAQAAGRVGISEAQMRVIANRDGLGRKEGGAWSFSESEINRLVEQRKTHAAAIKLRKRLENDRRRMNGLPPKRKKPKRRAAARRFEDDEVRPRRRRGGPVTIDDVLNRMRDPFVQIDMLLARERAIEQRYNLPFRAPASTRYGLIACPRCGQQAVLLIDCDSATDEAGIDAYERLCGEIIERYKLPTVLRLPLDRPADDPASRTLLRLRWSDTQLPELHHVDKAGWDELLDQIIEAHCLPPA